MPFSQHNQKRHNPAAVHKSNLDQDLGVRIPKKNRYQNASGRLYI